MAHKINGRGTLRVDRVFRGIGRIARASGTSNAKTFKAIDVMLTELYETGRWTILEEIKSGVVTPLEVYAYWREGRLAQIPSSATLLMVSPTFEKWLEKHDVTAGTRRTYKSFVGTYVAALGNHTWQDVPKYLLSYREICESDGKHRTFNATQVTLLAYVTNVLGKNSKVREEIVAIKKLTETSEPALQFTPEQAKTFICSLNHEHSGIALTLLFTGMNWKEARGSWQVDGDGVVIEGTKAKGRVRTVPRFLESYTKPTIALSSYHKAMKRRDSRFSTYSFRRTFAHWMQEAGIPYIRRQMYMGHSGGSMTDRYERHEVEAYLREDREKVLNYVLSQVPDFPLDMGK